jgi:hypothetical protein
MKRSVAPTFWLLFGAGGMLSALFGPALVLITGLAAPTGIGISPAFISYGRARRVASRPPKGRRPAPRPKCLHETNKPKYRSTRSSYRTSRRMNETLHPPCN